MTIKKKLLLFNLTIVSCPFVILLVFLLMSSEILDAFFAKEDNENSIIEIMQHIDNEFDSILTDMQKTTDTAKSSLFDEDVQKHLMKEFSQHNFFVEIIEGKNNKSYNLNELEKSDFSYVFINGAKSSMDIITEGTKQSLTLEREVASKLHDYTGLWIDELDFVYISKKIKTPDGIFYYNMFTSGTEALLEGIGTSSIFDLLFSLSIGFIIGLSTILLVCFICSVLLIKSIVNPINQLGHAITRMKHGELGHNINYENNDELTLVCQTFNDMQKTLKENLEKNEQYEKNRKEMLVGISHDLRTPLTSIISYVQAMQDGMAIDSNKHKKYLSVIHRKALNMEYLIQQLFHFSKLETKQMKFNKKNINLNTYLVNFLDKSEDEMKKMNVFFIYEDTFTNVKQNNQASQKDIYKNIYINADTNQLDRVLQNIIDNSIKYVEISPVVIALSLNIEKDTVQLVIQDNGHGVDKSIQSKIFDSFFCGNPSRISYYKGKEFGSGLGLAIVKNIIEAHDGTVHTKIDVNSIHDDIHNDIHDNIHNDTHDNMPTKEQDATHGLCIVITFPLALKNKESE